MTDARQLLRHTLATLAYRGAKAIRDAPPEFASFEAGTSTRTPVQILAHISDVLDWGWSIAKGEQAWTPKTTGEWDDEVRRFFGAIEAFDSLLDSETDLRESHEKLFQGPIADALQHVGQLTMLRRMAGGPIRGENFHRAEIVAGRVCEEQVPPKREFD